MDSWRLGKSPGYLLFIYFQLFSCVHSGFWVEWSLIWSFNAVVHPPQGLMCCACWDAFLFAMPVKKIIFELHYPSWQFKPICQFSSDLSSTRRFHPQNCCSLCVLLFFAPLCVNSSKCCVWKSQDISNFWNTQPTPSGSINHGTVTDSQRSDFFFILCSSHMIGWLESSINGKVYRHS